MSGDSGEEVSWEELERRYAAVKGLYLARFLVHLGVIDEEDMRPDPRSNSGWKIPSAASYNSIVRAVYNVKKEKGEIGVSREVEKKFEKGQDATVSQCNHYLLKAGIIEVEDITYSRPSAKVIKKAFMFLDKNVFHFKDMWERVR